MPPMSTKITRARLTSTGWDTDLTVETAEVQPPSRDWVRVEVEACGVCYRDCIDRAGRFKFINLPITPGHEAVGHVTAVGPDVTEWQIGDRVATMHRDFCGRCDACQAGEISLCSSAAAVLGLLIDGGYATAITAPQRCFYAVDEQLPASHAAVLHCTFGTAFRGLKRFGELGDGDSVVITGANGGVGSAAVQVAVRLGATVIAVVRDERHREYLTELGAAHVIVDDGSTFHKKLPGLADVAMDCVGKPTFNSALRSLKVGGRLVAVGNIVPERAELNLGYIITRGIRIAGSSGATRDDMKNVQDLHRARPFDLALHAELPLDRADEAQRLVHAGGLRGRIVLVLDSKRGE